MNKPPDILDITCNGCQASKQKHLGVGQTCEGCETEQIIGILNRARDKNWSGYPYHHKKWLKEWLLDGTRHVSNLRIIALIEHYDLNKE